MVLPKLANWLPWCGTLLVETKLREKRAVPPDADVPIILDISDDLDINITQLVEGLDLALKILDMTMGQIVQKR